MKLHGIENPSTSTKASDSSLCWMSALENTEKAGPDDRYADVYVDTTKSKEVYWIWLEMARPGSQENGLRRPEVFERPFRPDRKSFFAE